MRPVSDSARKIELRDWCNTGQYVYKIRCKYENKLGKMQPVSDSARKIELRD
jgi:hypothetical protein